ncbi:MAG: glycosyltransferase [Deltaproteobacteria bacterium]|nr:glycosyltransferase [Deltaproteobacteria bacterium]
MIPRVMAENRRLSRRLFGDAPDLWLTYHAYYKGPDVIGPTVSARTGVPYVIFQGAYATKRRRDPRTLAGFWLNRRALKAARHVFVNKQIDFINLKRLLPPERVTYVSPGIFPQDFSFSEAARRELRRQWRVDDTPVVLTAAMFRPGVKFQGLSGVIRACGRLGRGTVYEFRFVVVGDGRQKNCLSQHLAQAELPDKVHFARQVSRTDMYRYYSAGVIFSQFLPQIGEPLEMVFLGSPALPWPGRWWRLPMPAFRKWSRTGTPDCWPLAMIREAFIRARGGSFWSMPPAAGTWDLPHRPSSAGSTTCRKTMPGSKGRCAGLSAPGGRCLDIQSGRRTMTNDEQKTPVSALFGTPKVVWNLRKMHPGYSRFWSDGRRQDGKAEHRCHLPQGPTTLVTGVSAVILPGHRATAAILNRFCKFQHHLRGRFARAELGSMVGSFSDPT